MKKKKATTIRLYASNKDWLENQANMSGSLKEVIRFAIVMWGNVDILSQADHFSLRSNVALHSGANNNKSNSVSSKQNPILVKIRLGKKDDDIRNWQNAQNDTVASMNFLINYVKHNFGGENFTEALYRRVHATILQSINSPQNISQIQVNGSSRVQSNNQAVYGNSPKENRSSNVIQYQESNQTDEDEKRQKELDAEAMQGLEMLGQKIRKKRNNKAKRKANKANERKPQHESSDLSSLKEDENDQDTW